MGNHSSAKAGPGTLEVRRVAIDTRESVAGLHRDGPVHRTEGFHAPAEIEGPSVEAIATAGGGRP